MTIENETRLQDRLLQKLQCFLSEPLTNHTLQIMKTAIDDVVRSALSDRLDTTSLKWLSSKYFQSIKLNSECNVSDMIVSNDYQLSELPLLDIVFLVKFLADTRFAQDLEKELSRRTLS